MLRSRGRAPSKPEAGRLAESAVNGTATDYSLLRLRLHWNLGTCHLILEVASLLRCDAVELFHGRLPPAPKTQHLGRAARGQRPEIFPVAQGQAILIERPMPPMPPMLALPQGPPPHGTPTRNPGPQRARAAAARACCTRLAALRRGAQRLAEPARDWPCEITDLRLTHLPAPECLLKVLIADFLQMHGVEE